MIVTDVTVKNIKLLCNAYARVRVRCGEIMRTFPNLLSHLQLFLSLSQFVDLPTFLFCFRHMYCTPSPLLSRESGLFLTKCALFSK